MEGQECGDIVLSTREKPKYFKRGFAMPLKYVPDKASICQIEFEPNKGAQLCRAAGTTAKLLNKNGTKRGFGLVELQSKELRLFDLDCMCVLGRCSNIYHNKINWGKAGNRRKLGWRPKVHGTSMNAVDHPHGHGHFEVVVERQNGARDVMERRREVYAKRECQLICNES